MATLYVPSFAGKLVSVLRASGAGAILPGTATGRAAAALLNVMTHRSCNLLLFTDGNSASHTVFQVTFVLSLVIVMMSCFRFIASRTE